MNLDDAKMIVNFLNAHEPHLDKWEIILDRQGETDKYGIGLPGCIADTGVIVIYEPISILSVIVERGKHWDHSSSVDSPSPIRTDDNLWDVLYLVYRAVRGGSWDKL